MMNYTHKNIVKLTGTLHSFAIVMIRILKYANLFYRNQLQYEHQSDQLLSFHKKISDIISKTCLSCCTNSEQIQLTKFLFFLFTCFYDALLAHGNLMIFTRTILCCRANRQAVQSGARAQPIGQPGGIALIDLRLEKSIIGRPWFNFWQGRILDTHNSSAPGPKRMFSTSLESPGIHVSRKKSFKAVASFHIIKRRLSLN